MEQQTRSLAGITVISFITDYITKYKTHFRYQIRTTIKSTFTLVTLLHPTKAPDQ